MTVQEVFDQLLVRLPGPAQCGIFEAVREVLGIVANRLLLKRSELLRKNEDAELFFPVGAQSAALPSDFRALFARPFVADKRGAEPSHYEVRGPNLRIDPVATDEVTIQVPYFYKPSIPSSLSDTLPFDGEFDSVIVEGVVAIASQGLAAVSDPRLVAVIQSQVDAVLEARSMLEEQLLADSINGI